MVMLIAVRSAANSVCRWALGLLRILYVTRRETMGHWLLRLVGVWLPPGFWEVVSERGKSTEFDGSRCLSGTDISQG